MAENKPFFLNLSQYAVHTPIMPDKRFLAKYKAQGLDDTEAAYATLLEGMDKGLGDIMDFLEKIIWQITLLSCLCQTMVGLPATPARAEKEHTICHCVAAKVLFTRRRA